MKIDPDKVDEAVLGLLYLVSFERAGVTHAWKGHDWDALNRLHESGLISNPKSKTKSVSSFARRGPDVFGRSGAISCSGSCRSPGLNVLQRGRGIAGPVEPVGGVL